MYVLVLEVTEQSSEYVWPGDFGWEEGGGGFEAELFFIFPKFQFFMHKWA